MGMTTGRPPFEIVPSIASANQLRLGGEIARLGNLPRLHLDIEDGNFVPSITFGMKTVRQIAEAFDKELDAHLLVTDAMAYLDGLRKCGVRRVAAHFESTAYPLDLIRAIQKRGMLAGLALNFKTGCGDIEPFLAAADYIVVMTAEPDGREQQFYPPMCDKIRELRSRMDPAKELWVDGGIGERELELAAAAGADKAVMGRYLFAAENPEQTVLRLQLRIEAKRRGL